MSLIFVPRNLPALPSVAQTRTRRPVRGATLAALADRANHLAGYRRLRMISQFLEGALDADTHYTPQLSGEGWMRWTSGLVATHIWLAVAYTAQDNGATGGEPLIDAALEDPAAAVLDAGIRWRRGNGTLPAFAEEDVRLAPGYIGVQQVYTPPQPSGADGASLTAPRPLVLPAPGTDVVLHLSWQNCRVYSVTAIEIYQETL